MTPALDMLLREDITLWIITGIFSLLIGSFLNVVIARIPRQIIWSEAEKSARGEKPPGIVWPGSHCPGCKHPLSWFENVPILSFFLLGGRCRHCHISISVRYPMIEVFCATLSVVVVMKLGVQWLTLAALVFTWFLIALAFIDLEHFLLPDKLTIPLIFVGLLTSALGGFTDLTSSLIGVIAGYLSLWIVYQIFRLLTGKEGFGFGDFKMLAAIGSFIGWQLLPTAVLLSAGTGAVAGTIMILLQRHQRGQLVPFGPYLAGGGWLTLLWGPELNEWFYSIIAL